MQEAVATVDSRVEGRTNVNSLNAVPIRQIYERWMNRYSEFWSDQLLRIQEDFEPGRDKHGPPDSSKKK